MPEYIWLVYDPEEGFEEYTTEEEARSALQDVVEHYQDDASEGWHPDAEQIALYKAEKVASLKLKVLANAEDDTEDGEKCRNAGWDYFAEGVVVEEE